MTFITFQLCLHMGINSYIKHFLIRAEEVKMEKK